MNEFLNKWFESKIERITIIVALIIGIIVATLAMIIELVGIENRPLVAIMIGIFAITLIFVIRGKTEFGRWLIPFVSFATVALLVYRGGLRDGATLALPLVISIGGLFLWRGGNILFGTLSIITAFIVGYGEANGFIKNYLSHTTSINDAFLITILLLGQTGLQDLLMRRLSKYLREANEETILEQKANQELRALQATLEERIHERTAALERTTLAVERRASQLQAISDIARTIASIQELSELLPRITELISEYFGFYHVGIFLLDEKKEYAELRAANSEGGKRMLARSHRLRVGYQGVVGFAARQGRARIALDTGEDAVFFDNPDLPTTRSEAALPLILGDEVIGVLDVQSEIPEAFSEDDLDVLNTLAFQVSIAIQNATLLNQARQMLAEIERTSRERTRVSWSNIGERGQKLGYRFDNGIHDPIYQPVELTEVGQALATGKQQQSEQTLAIPIKLRGETIGVIGIRAKSERKAWTAAEISIAQAAADRAALALENARLVEEAQRRAALERMTAEITGKIGTSVQYRSIMRITAEELSRALGTEVLVQLQPET